MWTTFRFPWPISPISGGPIRFRSFQAKVVSHSFLTQARSDSGPFSTLRTRTQTGQIEHSWSKYTIVTTLLLWKKVLFDTFLEPMVTPYQGCILGLSWCGEGIHKMMCAKCTIDKHLTACIKTHTKWAESPCFGFAGWSLMHFVWRPPSKFQV